MYSIRFIPVWSFLTTMPVLPLLTRLFAAILPDSPTNAFPTLFRIPVVIPSTVLPVTLPVFLMIFVSYRYVSNWSRDNKYISYRLVRPPCVTFLVIKAHDLQYGTTADDLMLALSWIDGQRRGRTCFALEMRARDIYLCRPALFYQAEGISACCLGAFIQWQT